MADYSQVQVQDRKELILQKTKESNLNYLFHNLSSQVKGQKDNQTVRFEFEFTSYIITVPYRHRGGRI